MYPWLVLLPPIIVIVLATVTRKISWSILAGIVAGLLILHDFSFPEAMQDFMMRLWRTAEVDALLAGDVFSLTYLYICLFLLVLTVIVTMLGYSGGAHAYGNFVMKYLKKPEQAEKASLLLSLFFCVDDYFGSLAVGSVMQPVADRFKIARVKLALLVNGMAAPLVVIFPISSWVAEIMMQLRQSGVGPENIEGVLVRADLLPFYLSVIPFIFYAFLAVAALWLLVWMRSSYGVLLKHEDIAQRTGNLFAGKMPLSRRFANIDQKAIAGSSLIDFLFPITLLFAAVFVAILYFGQWSGFGGQASLLLALQKSNVAAALFFGASVTLFFSSIFLLIRRKITCRQVPKIFAEGVMLMLPSVITLVLIWTLSSILKGDLATGQYLATLLVGSVKLAYLPALFFLITALTAATMGSAWGAIGIFVPVAIPMLIGLSGVAVPTTVVVLPLLLPLVGAIISGAVVGNHLSPISDTMLMASTSTGAYHIDLVRVQMAFTMPIIASAAISFLISGIMISAGVSIFTAALAGLGVGLVMVAVLLKGLALVSRRKIL
jgi:tetracycline resistance efflux pump